MIKYSSITSFHGKTVKQQQQPTVNLLLLPNLVYCTQFIHFQTKQRWPYKNISVTSTPWATKKCHL